ncbi:NUDIX hydrolase [Streptomyces sp. NBC_01439]|uniref:NUDIX hydrolase n=1 Tax=Streptomyces sp. NBC_01439 TaxID=2903867 RepID=UPI002E2DD0F3|nr:NUDIX hydrolase [Streptomyces sp. NBC_01439]
MPDRPSPLVAATGVVLDTRGRVLVLTTPGRTDPELPGGAVHDTETPEEGLARALREGLNLELPAGRLLAVDSRPPATTGTPGTPRPPGRSLIVHVHLVGPLPASRASTISFPVGATTEARWLPPEAACALLPAPVAPRLRAALAALHTGSFAHLVDGVPQPGSPAGLDPARRVALEHSGTLDPASHRASRPKAVTAASVLFTGSDGRILLVQPAYGRSDRWNLPGGGIDSDLGEIPRAAARREVHEELGLDLAPGRLLAVNWSHKPGRPARIRFLYDGGVLDAPTLARIRLDRAELLQWRTVTPAELPSLVKPALRRQITACLTARATGAGPLELHAGRP